MGQVVQEGSRSQAAVPLGAPEEQDPLIGRLQRRRVMVQDVQRASPHQGKDVLAGHIPQVLMPGARCAVRRCHLFGLTEQRKWGTLHKQQRSPGLEQRGHARQRLVDIDNVVQRAQAQNVVVACGFTAKRFDPT